MRPELEPLPRKMRNLPLDQRGYPVPWFVEWVDGVPEFRAMDRHKWRRALHESLCWVCGGPLGRHRTFLIGPMCAINRTTSEPPGHHECAVWSARNCPFLSRPQMVRREDEAINQTTLAESVAGLPLTRNPGVALCWCTQRGGYATFRDPRGLSLINLRMDPERLEWFAEGRAATRAEVVASIDSGLPALMDIATRFDGPAGVTELRYRRVQAERWFPA